MNDPKVETLPGVEPSPEVVLNRAVERLPNIVAVTVILELDDGRVEVEWSDMTAAQLALQSLVLQQSAVQIAYQSVT